MKKKYAIAGALAFAASGFGVLGFAPASSAQTIGACANPSVCGFINASGFLILGFANGTVGFIAPTGPGVLPFSSPSAPAPSATRAAAPGGFSLGSLPVSNTAALASVPSNFRLANSTVPASHGHNGVDPVTAAAVVLGLMGLYGVTFAVRRRATST